jgi:DNA-binding Lrp family transcriptional regulator
MTSPDRIDAGILELLTTNPRAGMVGIARELGVARGTVQARLAKLEQRGAIGGLGIDPAQIGYPVLAFVFLEIVQGRLDEAVATLERIPEIMEAFGTTGPRDLICRVVARDNGHLQDIINVILHAGPVRRSTSYIAMSTQIAPRTLPLIDAAAR